jgi:hypothetical protein
MSEYYVEIPFKKQDIEFPERVKVIKRTRGRFCFVSCEDEDDSFFEYWLDGNGINYQES